MQPMLVQDAQKQAKRRVRPVLARVSRSVTLEIPICEGRWAEPSTLDTEPYSAESVP